MDAISRIEKRLQVLSKDYGSRALASDSPREVVRLVQRKMALEEALQIIKEEKTK